MCQNYKYHDQKQDCFISQIKHKLKTFDNRGITINLELNKLSMKNSSSLFISIIMMVLLFFSCNERNECFCDEYFIITEENYHNLLENTQDLLNCKYIAMMRIKKPSLIEVLKVLEKSDSLSILSISHVNLDTLPSSIYKMTNLEKLVINSCDLSYISNELKNLTILKHLDLSDNQVANFPVISSIEYIDLSENHLTNLPAELFEVKSLKILNIENNNIDFINYKNLKWPNIYKFIIYNNNLSKSNIDSLAIFLGNDVVVNEREQIE